MERIARDISVTPIASEAALRNVDWIEGNQKKVDQLSGGKLAYVYLPDTGEGGFTNFNRYYFAQTEKQGAIIDERFNGGGQVADYFVEVLGRHIESYWAPRYGAIEHTPNAGIYGPKVMIANEFSGSGGDALPWLFKQAKLGPLVGKRTWGGLVGIGCDSGADGRRARDVAERGVLLAEGRVGRGESRRRSGLRGGAGSEGGERRARSAAGKGGGAGDGGTGEASASGSEEAGLSELPQITTCVGLTAPAVRWMGFAQNGPGLRYVAKTLRQGLRKNGIL